MLGYVRTEGLAKGAADALLASLAETLGREGILVAGVAQINTEREDGLRCHMDLSVLGTPEQVRISQNLGPGASGCRLDPSGLETAAARVEADLQARRPSILILNKFGKQEVDGRGFRPVIARAMEMGIPTLTGVGSFGYDAFRTFAGEFGEELPAAPEAMLTWCRDIVRASA